MEGSGKYWKAFAIILGIVLVMPMIPAAIKGSGNAGDNNPEAAPQPVPEHIVGRDLIVSYDEPENENNALHPAVAMAPRNSPFENCIYAVWDEFDENGGYREIHFSMSGDGGLTWNHDHDDFIISHSQKGKANNGPAVKPSIAVDLNGVIHVIWAERISSDGTWEVFYSRSIDNGDHWSGVETGDIQVSHRAGSEGDGQTISAPKIAVGIPENKAPQMILHAVWTEYTPKDGQEVHYSRSTNGGLTWSGLEADDILSIPQNGRFTYNPTIAVSGAEANFVHVAWSQRANYEFNEVFYVTSEHWGEKGTWTEETPISFPANDNMNILNISITGGYNNDVHVVWTQQDLNKAPQVELFYSSSPNNGQYWTGREKDWRISYPDGHPASVPSVSVDPNMITYAIWTEIDENSPLGTMEIHSSWTDNPFDPESWSGQKDDNVESYGDDWGMANAKNASVVLGSYKGDYIPVFVWDELNDEPTYKLNDRASQNTEIHTNPPEWVLDTYASGSGYITKNPDQGTYANGDPVILTAIAYAGWSFNSWGGDLGGSTNPQTIIMDDDKYVIAYFTQDQYTLTINIYGSGSVTKIPDQPTYTYGQVVTLTATPVFGWRFDHWSGAVSGSTNPISTVMYSSKTVNAYFYQNVNYINLTVGWNLVSLPLVQSSTAIGTVLSSISGSYNSVMYFSTTDKADPWKTYRPGSTTNDLTAIDHKMGVWIRATSACMLTVYGNRPTSTSIQLYAGWNLVGYPTQVTTRTVSTAFAGTGYDIVEGWQVASPYVKVLAGGDAVLPGNGYWVHVPSDTTWTINW